MSTTSQAAAHDGRTILQEIDTSALAMHIKGRLHHGACPGHGALGELSYIEDEGIIGNTQRWQAWMYAWKDSLTSTEVAQWFSEFGCSHVSVFHQLHDSDNDIYEGKSEDDGVRPLMVYFSSLAQEVSDQANAADSAEVDPGLSKEVYRACEVLPEGWEIRIVLEKGYGVVVLIDPRGGDHELPANGLMSDALRISVDAAIDGHRQGIA